MNGLAALRSRLRAAFGVDDTPPWSSDVLEWMTVDMERLRKHLRLQRSIRGAEQGLQHGRRVMALNPPPAHRRWTRVNRKPAVMPVPPRPVLHRPDAHFR